MGIPFIDLKKQFEFLEKDIKAVVMDVLESGQYIMGPQVRELEAALADYVGVEINRPAAWPASTIRT